MIYIAVSRSQALVLPAVALAGLAMLAIVDVAPVPFLLSAFLGIYCGAVTWREYRAQSLVSPLALYGVLFAVHFAVPGMFFSASEDHFVDERNATYLEQAIAYIALCFVGVHIGCRLAESAARPITESARATRFLPGRTAFVVLTLTLLGLAARAIVLSADAYFQVTRTDAGALAGPYYAVVRMVELFPLFALALWSLYHFSKKHPTRPSSWALFFLFFIEFGYWLPSGRKEGLILAIVIPLVARYMAVKRLPSLRVGVTAAVLIVALVPIMTYYRSAMELVRLTGASSTEVIVEAAGAANVVANLEDASPLQLVLNRFSLVEPISACIRLYENSEFVIAPGQPYLVAMAALIPRLLWPDKPDLHYGTQFGHASGLSYLSDWATSVSVTFPGEAFLNLSWGGVLVMFVLGFGFSALYYAQQWGVRWQFLYLVSLPTLLYIGGTFAIYFSGLAKLLLFFYLISFWITARGSDSPARSL
jgi:hypothetical protein